MDPNSGVVWTQGKLSSTFEITDLRPNIMRVVAMEFVASTILYSKKSNTHSKQEKKLQRTGKKSMVYLSESYRSISRYQKGHGSEIYPRKFCEDRTNGG